MIQTVTGAINKTDLGAVLMHEHISCSSIFFSNAFGKKWLDNRQGIIMVLWCIENLKNIIKGEKQ
ncbi:MAG: hypothetical protein J6Q76_03145 [Clostridia bacterium]|nr:hypothetical protein [Clostridia bacterium]